MNKTILFGIMLLLTITPFANAAEIQQPSQFRYAWENTVGFFKFSKEAKINYNLELADKRMAEYQWAVQNNETKTANKIMTKYQQNIGKAQKEITKLGTNEDKLLYQERLQLQTQEHTKTMEQIKLNASQEIKNMLNLALNNEKSITEIKENIEEQIKKGAK